LAARQKVVDAGLPPLLSLKASFPQAGSVGQNPTKRKSPSMNFKLILVVVLLLVCLHSANAQRRVYGQVTDILDGNTLVLNSLNTNIKVRIQFIDSPEPSQPLYDIVKEHLALLVNGQNVEVRLSSSGQALTFGKVLLGGQDIAIQMLRDGAAWYSVPDAESQADDDRAEYLRTESLAKDEKRGIWGIANLRPAYELRLEREKVAREKREAERQALLERISRTGMRPPTIGMSYLEFDIVCGHSRFDAAEGSEDGASRDLKVFLERSEQRGARGCIGYFHFENGKLIYMSRTNRD
jgi:endonuclease YncB( thermonuclease family)